MTVTISDWEQYPLPQAQITYAAMDAIVSLWLHESPELRAGAAAAKAVVVQDAAAKAVVLQDTANAWKAMAFKDIQDLRRRIDAGRIRTEMLAVTTVTLLRTERIRMSSQARVMIHMTNLRMNRMRRMTMTRKQQHMMQQNFSLD
jgi:ribonuclease D